MRVLSLVLIISKIEHHFNFPVDRLHPLSQASAFLGVVGKIVMGVSRPRADFLMDMTSLVALLAAESVDGYLDANRRKEIPQTPSTASAAMKLFKLDPVTTTYAACPTCNCTYPPITTPGSSSPVYPSTCSNFPSPDSVMCNTELLRSGTPIKPFLHYHFKDYLAGLLSSPTLERLMDDSSDAITRSLHDPPPQFVSDILEAKYVKELLGPGGAHFFSDRKGKGRYLFGLNIDFFAPEGLSIHGGAISCGVISLVCLNLPLDIRYKPENMCLLGVIPGPKEPSLDEINHYLRPIVDEFVAFWEPGIHFSRTALHPEGKTCEGAIVPHICDSPAARKLNQMTSPRSAWFCTRCKCHHLSTLGRTNCENWEIRGRDELREQANAWKAALTTVERNHLVKQNGIRYSELWHLDYYDPADQTITDPMHCILEGVCQHHCRELLKLTTAEATAPPEVIPAFKYDFKVPHSLQSDPKDIKGVIKAHALLTAPAPCDNPDEIELHLGDLQKKLEKLRLASLKFICEDLQCIPIKETYNDRAARVFKVDFAKALVAWRRRRPMVTHAIAQRVTTPDVLNRIREVIRDTVTPSWVESVPPLFGDPLAGTLKAAEWRVMITIYLPIALVSLWGAGTSHDSSRLASRLRSVLDHTMLLVAATLLVCMRTMTTSRVETYRSCITSYVAQIPDLFPEASHRPNHHYAQHIPDFLTLFGPAHSWWCFPFECLIGLLQQLPHNHQLGKVKFIAGPLTLFNMIFR